MVHIMQVPKTKDFKTWTDITRYYKGGYDSANAYKAFQKCPTHKVNRCLPNSTNIDEVELGSFDAGAFCSIYASKGPADWVSGDPVGTGILYIIRTQRNGITI